MASIVCPKCGTSNLADATKCFKCDAYLKHPQLHPNQGENTSQEEHLKTKILSYAITGMSWIGRLWGIVLIVFLPIILLFNYSSFPENSGNAYLIIFAVIVVGMIVAWWRQGLGALLSLAGLVGFYAAVWAYERSNLQNWVQASICILPSLVFLLASSLLRMRLASKSHEGPGRVD